MMQLKIDPVATMIEVVNTVHPDLDLEVVYDPHLYENEDCFSMVWIGHDESLQLFIDLSTPIGGVTQEIAQGVAIARVEVLEEEEEEAMEDIARYLMERFEMVYTNLVNQNYDPVLH